MASDLQWDHHFCLACDKQTDGAAYCSESCRLADYEEATTKYPSSAYGSGSPSWAPTSTSTYALAMGAPSARSRQLFSLAPAYDFSHAQPYGSTPTYGVSHMATRRASPTNSSSAASSNLYASASTSALLLPPTTVTTSATTTSVTYQHALSPSSSHSSLSSIRSGSSSGGALGALSAFANGSSASSQTAYGSASSASDLSERVRSELRKYASSLEQGKLQRNLQRRRSC